MPDSQQGLIKRVSLSGPDYYALAQKDQETSLKLCRRSPFICTPKQAQSLSLITDLPMSVSEFLKMAVHVTSALVVVHEQKLVHNGLVPK